MDEPETNRVTLDERSRYERYVRWCEARGLTAAQFGIWERTMRGIDEHWRDINPFAW
jgi:hypothetical protein